MNAYTTIEESKQLIEAGLDVNTADMFYSRRPTGKSEYSVFPDFKPEGRLEVFTKVDLSCWSLAALIDLMPNKIEEVKDHFVELVIGYPKDKWCIMYFDDTGLQHGPYFESKSIVESACNMIIWLLKNNYIKSNKNE